jgi:hypothetical protein
MNQKISIINLPKRKNSGCRFGSILKQYIFKQFHQKPLQNNPF